MKKLILLAVAAVMIMGAAGVGLWVAAPMLNTLGLTAGSNAALNNTSADNSVASLFDQANSDTSPAAAPASLTPTTGTDAQGSAMTVRRLVMRDLIHREVQAIAKTLNLTPQQLKTDLENGQTMAEIAKAQNISTETLKQVIVDQAKVEVDHLVQTGKITRDQGNNFLQHLRAEIIINHHLNKQK